MKRLIYVPIIHTSADLGSLGKDITKRGITDLGEDFWSEHLRTVDEFWQVIANYFDSIDVSEMKIYQDGMVAEGEMGEKIVGETAKMGSKNYELVLRLLKRGAVLMKTEDFPLVKKEHDRLLAITQAKSLFEKLIAFIKYKLAKNGLLDHRDQFIAQQIDRTLNHGERAILFIGAYHNIKKRLPQYFQVIEIKDIQKIREYQKLLPFHEKYRERFKELSQYLIFEVVGQVDSLEQIKKIFCEKLGTKPEKINLESSIIDGLGRDSLDTLEIVIALEEKFGIDIPDEDLEKMVTVKDIVNYIERRKE